MKLTPSQESALLSIGDAMIGKRLNALHKVIRSSDIHGKPEGMVYLEVRLMKIQDGRAVDANV